jgi:tryptophanase
MTLKASGGPGLERGGPPLGDERRFAEWVVANCDTNGATVEDIIEARAAHRAGVESRKVTPTGDAEVDRVRSRIDARLNNNIPTAVPITTTGNDPATARARRFLKGSR